MDSSDSSQLEETPRVIPDVQAVAEDSTTHLPSAPWSSQASSEWEEVPCGPRASACPLSDAPPSASSSDSSVPSLATGSLRQPGPDGILILDLGPMSPPQPPPNPFRIPLPNAGLTDVSPVRLLVDDIDLSKPMARGAFGALYKAKLKETGETVLAKFISHASWSWGNGKARTLNEINCHKKASSQPYLDGPHPLIVPILGSYMAEDHGCKWFGLLP